MVRASKGLETAPEDFPRLHASHRPLLLVKEELKCSREVSISLPSTWD